MSPAFLGGLTEYLPKAEVTVDWFHIVQTFTKRLDEVRKKERHEQEHPKSLRWELLKSLENENLTPKQVAALPAMVAEQSATDDAWVIKEKLYAGSRKHRRPERLDGASRITSKPCRRRFLKSHY